MENPNTKPGKICPTCGTRAPIDAARCLVCGTEFSDTGKNKSAAQDGGIRGTRMPRVSLSIPVMLLLFLVFLGIGAGLVYFALQSVNAIAEPTPVPTDTQTPTPSLTPTPITPTATLTALPSPTPLTYFVQSGDSCGLIAAIFNVSVQSIILQNNLGANCPLFEGQELKVPYPTPTPTPQATSTLTNEQATIEACETRVFTVQENETLSLIAETTGVSVANIMEWNGKTVDTAFVGETIVVPLCKRGFVPGVGTSTPTAAPPYSAPELLLPRNGGAFDLSSDTVTLQWSSVGELRENEFYQITIIDLTGGQNVQLVVEVRDTKFIVPASFRPKDNTPHAFEWFVVPVAQIGVTETGEPIFVSGGPVSEHQIFIWTGAVPKGTPTP